MVAGQGAHHEPLGGIVPNIATQRHSARLPDVVLQALSDAGREIGDIDIVAVTRGPGLPPCLAVGLNAAKTMAAVCGKPIGPVHHMVRARARVRPAGPASARAGASCVRLTLQRASIARRRHTCSRHGCRHLAVRLRFPSRFCAYWRAAATPSWFWLRCAAAVAVLRRVVASEKFTSLAVAVAVSGRLRPAGKHAGRRCRRGFRQGGPRSRSALGSGWSPVIARGGAGGTGENRYSRCRARLAVHSMHILRYRCCPLTGA